jgi:poly-gamma-glutamate capsule biosynthesis protein CapA/YwtB (metallophosphatase superfamily)
MAWQANRPPMRYFIRAHLRSFAAVFCLLSVATAACAQKVTFLAVGDICLAQGVEKKMAQKGRGYPFDALRPLLKQADIVFGNLECCLATSGRKVPKTYNFRGHPRGALALREAGFTVVSLANNHSLDYGRVALAETLRHLNEQKVIPVGGGRTLAEAHAVRIVSVRGLRVGFLAYLGLFPSVLPLHDNEPGLAMASLDAIRRDVRAARKKVDVLIVSLHAGEEYHFTHSARQREMARAAIDAGADMVIGHHPHVVQDTEIYRGKPIFYSLGNFVFNPSPQFLRDGGKRWSGMVAATLERGKPPAARLVDLRIVDRQPRLAHPRDAAALAHLLNNRGASR